MPKVASIMLDLVFWRALRIESCLKSYSFCRLARFSYSLSRSVSKCYSLSMLKILSKLSEKTLLKSKVIDVILDEKRFSWRGVLIKSQMPPESFFSVFSYKSKLRPLWALSVALELVCSILSSNTTLSVLKWAIFDLNLPFWILVRRWSMFWWIWSIFIVSSSLSPEISIYSVMFGSQIFQSDAVCESWLIDRISLRTFEKSGILHASIF